MSPLIGLRFSDRRHGEEESGRVKDEKRETRYDQQRNGSLLLFVMDCCVRERK
jgi:hypothetical protein